MSGLAAPETIKERRQQRLKARFEQMSAALNSAGAREGAAAMIIYAVIGACLGVATYALLVENLLNPR